jgi:ribosomal protein L5
LEIPKIHKVVIKWAGDCKDNAKALETAVAELTQIAAEAHRHQGAQFGGKL